MPSRKVYVNVTTRLIIRMEEGVDVEDVLSNMDYDFRSTDDDAEIEDMEIREHEVTCSK